MSSTIVEANLAKEKFQSVRQHKWHPNHDDPSDDITFLNTSGVVCKASSFKLAKTCQYFRDPLLKFIEEPDVHHQRVFRLDFDSEAFDTFLILAQYDQDVTLVKQELRCLAPAAVVEVHWWCKHFEYKHMKPIYESLDEAVKTDPMAVLVQVSNRSRYDSSIGVKAVEALWTQLDQTPLDSLPRFWLSVRKLHPGWRFAVTYALFGHKLPGSFPEPPNEGHERGENRYLGAATATGAAERFLQGIIYRELGETRVAIVPAKRKASEAPSQSPSPSPLPVSPISQSTVESFSSSDRSRAHSTTAEGSQSTLISSILSSPPPG